MYLIAKQPLIIREFFIIHFLEIFENLYCISFLQISKTISIHSQNYDSLF